MNYRKTSGPLLVWAGTVEDGVKVRVVADCDKLNTEVSWEVDAMRQDIWVPALQYSRAGAVIRALATRLAELTPGKP